MQTLRPAPLQNQSMENIFFKVLNLYQTVRAKVTPVR